MQPEELLKPRYKVIADYPKSIHPIGTIYNCGGTSEDLLYCDRDGPRMRDYPHLFKPLAWWEDRKVEEMPEYVKEGGQVFKATWKEGAVTENGKQPMRMGLDSDYADWQVISNVMCHYEPSTETEYNAYINKQ